MRITEFGLVQLARTLARRVGSFFGRPRVRRITLSVLSSLLAILLIVFCFYHFTRMPESEIEYMLATEVTTRSTLAAEAVIFREEIPVGSGSGLSVPLVPTGEHVSKDTPIATVYTGGAEYLEYYRLISERVARLSEARAEKDALADLSALEADIRSLSLEASALLESGNGGAAETLMEEILLLRTRTGALKESGASLTELIDTLTALLSEVTEKAGEVHTTLVSEMGGYYYPDADGFGSVCAPSALEALDGRGFLSLRETLNGDAPRLASGGVLVPSAEWSVAVPTELSADALSALTVGATYPVIFEDEGGVEVPMTLERVVEGTEDAPSLLILSTLRVPQGFSFRRITSVYVVTEEETGFSIPTAAVHELNGIPGVYVLEGNVMVFCRVEILKKESARYLVKTTDPTPDTDYTSNTYRYIRRYDAVILSGTDLYHGRIFS